MSEVPVMPTDLAFGKVIGRFILVVADATDPDRNPDPLPASGKITFSPAAPLMKSNSPVPTTVVKTLVTCSINAMGELIDPQGEIGVWLVTGVYKVTYSLNGASLNSHDIEVLPTHDDITPLDLTNALPAPIPVTASQYAELSSRIDALNATNVTFIESTTAPPQPTDPYTYWIDTTL